MILIARTCVLPLGFAALLAAGSPASAQISGTPVTLPNSVLARNSTAYDAISQVYLVIVERPPVVGRFLDKNGVQIGADFTISLESNDPNPPFVGWVSVASGGTPSDPAFLVTYTVADLNTNPKYGRLVRYRAGMGATVSARSKIFDVNGEWLESEKAQNFWDGQQFIVGTRVLPPGNASPVPQVNHFDLAGNVSAPVNLGDNLDYEGSPAIACVPNGVCVAAGFEAGIPTGYSGGSYARLFDSTTLQPRGSLFSLETNNPNEDQGVVYESHSGRFLAEWFRGGANVIDTRFVNLDGTMSALDLTKGIGQEAGTNAISYNATTKTALLLTKLTGGVLTAMELGDDGQPVRPNNTVVVTPWDGQVPDFYPSVTSDAGSARWLATANLGSGGVGVLIQGTPAGGAPIVTTPAITTAASLPSGVAGTVYSLTLVASGGAAPLVWSKVSGTLPQGIALSGASLSGTPTSVGDFAFRLRVTGADSGFAERDFTLSIAAAGTTPSPNPTPTPTPTPTPSPTPTPGAKHGADFDGDGKSDIAVFRPSAGSWIVTNSSSGATTTFFLGVSGDIPVPGDYDGDGKTDIAIFRPSTGQWMIETSSSNFSTAIVMQFGAHGDVPVPADYDGDKKTDIAVYRPSTQTWLILKSSTNFTTSLTFTWGTADGVPMPGDFDGDGKADPTVYSPSIGMWFVLKSSSNYTIGFNASWGAGADIPLVGDFDGDGKSDIAVYRPSDGAWFVLKSTTNFTTWIGLGWGAPGDIPIVGDFDGDGRADFAVYRPSTGAWIVAGSKTSYQPLVMPTLGTSTDIPVFIR